MRIYNRRNCWLEHSPSLTHNVLRIPQLIFSKPLFNFKVLYYVLWWSVIRVIAIRVLQVHWSKEIVIVKLRVILLLEHKSQVPPTTTRTSTYDASIEYKKVVSFSIQRVATGDPLPETRTTTNQKTTNCCFQSIHGVFQTTPTTISSCVYVYVIMTISLQQQQL